MRCARAGAVGLGLLMMLLVPATQAATRTFDPAGLTVYADGDDGSENAALGFDVDFFGTTYSDVNFNSNGNLSLDTGFTDFDPSALDLAGVDIIAPFWADVNPSNVNSAAPTYGAVTVNGRPAFTANYIDVAYFGSGDPAQLNSFQAVLIGRGDVAAGAFDVEFNYDQISWESGAASGGTAGLGGDPPRVGFASADGTQVLEVDGSGVVGALLDNGASALVANSNVGLAGRYAFSFRGGVPVAPDVAAYNSPFLEIAGDLVHMFGKPRAREQRFLEGYFDGEPTREAYVSVDYFDGGIDANEGRPESDYDVTGITAGFMIRRSDLLEFGGQFSGHDGSGDTDSANADFDYDGYMGSVYGTLGSVEGGRVTLSVGYLSSDFDYDRQGTTTAAVAGSTDIDAWFTNLRASLAVQIAGAYQVEPYLDVTWIDAEQDGLRESGIDGMALPNMDLTTTDLVLGFVALREFATDDLEGAVLLNFGISRELKQRNTMVEAINQFGGVSPIHQVTDDGLTVPLELRMELAVGERARVAFGSRNELSRGDGNLYGGFAEFRMAL